MLRQQLMHRLIGLSIGLALCGSCLAEIVFDGLNSYSTYRGQALAMDLPSKKPAGVYILMEELSHRRIDYTAQTPDNRTTIRDAYGMIIEAEGFHSYIKGSNRDARIQTSQSAREAGSCLRVGRIGQAAFLFHVQVKTPGIYSFALDGSYVGLPRQATTVSLFTSSDHGATISNAVAMWKIQYATPGWGTIAMNLGGKNPSEVFTQEVYLDIGVNALYLNMGEGRHCDLDSLRVVHYSPNGNTPNQPETETINSNQSRQQSDQYKGAEDYKNAPTHASPASRDAYNTAPTDNKPLKMGVLLWLACMMVCIPIIIILFKRFLYKY